MPSRRNDVDAVFGIEVFLFALHAGIQILRYSATGVSFFFVSPCWFGVDTTALNIT